VLALFEGRWYRAKVLGKSGNDFKIYFVDYGNVSILLELLS